MPDSDSEILKTPEVIDPKSIAVVTTTYYPNWYPGEARYPQIADKLRGDLAIKSAQAAKEQGLQMIFVDGSAN